MTGHKPFSELTDKMSAESQSKVKEMVDTAISELAAQDALQMIRERSFSGRNPHLGKMINCQFCGLRHRENERQCKQTFATKNREGDPIQGELQPPEGLTNLTARQTYGATMFNKRRQKPRTRPTKPLTKWQRIIVEAHKRKHAEQA